MYITNTDIYITNLYIKKSTINVDKKLQKKIIGNDLFSHSLSSARESLTSVFGMGTGVPSQSLSPMKIV